MEYLIKYPNGKYLELVQKKIEDSNEKLKKTSVSTFISSMEKNKVTLQDKNSEDIQEKIASRIISRNDLCPCGSGKKYKNCHGR